MISRPAGISSITGIVTDARSNRAIHLSAAPQVAHLDRTSGLDFIHTVRPWLAAIGKSVGSSRLGIGGRGLRSWLSCSLWRSQTPQKSSLLSREKLHHGSRCAVAVPRIPFDPLKLADLRNSIEVASVRAGCRQVIEVLAFVIENALRPDHGRSAIDISVTSINGWFSPPVTSE